MVEVQGPLVFYHVPFHADDSEHYRCTMGGQGPVLVWAEEPDFLEGEPSLFSDPFHC